MTSVTILTLSANKTAIVVANKLTELAGAEITCLEIAEALVELGYDVSISAEEIGAPWTEHVPNGVAYAVFDDLPNCKEYDLAWVHHTHAAYRLLLDKAARPRFSIFSSLSHFEPLEAPPIEALRFSHYTVNSDENCEHFGQSYPRQGKHLSVLMNSVPERYFLPLAELGSSIRSLAVVSNHAPPEVLDLMHLLREQGVTVRHVGLGGEVERVSPEMLSRYDAIVTIGKTVQYCLAAGIPVFCYDRFGGPGWIGTDNLDGAAHANFSGRCTAIRHEADVLAGALSAGFEAACSQRAQLQQVARDRFRLVPNVAAALERAAMRPFVNDVGDGDRASLVRSAQAYARARSTTVELERQVHLLATTLERLSTQP